MARSLFDQTLSGPLDVARRASLALLELPKGQLLTLEDQSRALEERFGSLKAVFGRKEYRKADDMFFRFEKLPPLGKEYWFMLFSSTQANSKQQLIVTAGRGTGNYQVNETPAKTLPRAVAGGDEKHAAAIVWAFDKTKTVFIDGPSVTRATQAKPAKSGKSVKSANAKTATQPVNSLSISAANASVELSGAYPSYRLTVTKAGKTVASIALTEPRRGKAVEIQDMFRVPGLPGLGIGLVNLYFDFAGTLLGKPFKGSCYVQKVVCVTPFAPWNWSRVRFRDGSTLEFFVPRVELGHLKIPLERWARITDAKTQRTVTFEDIELEQIGDGATRRFLLTDREGELFVEMAGYAVQPFRFRSLGTFEYDEYLVEVKDLKTKTPAGWRTLDDYKGGVGIFEDATGYLL